MDDESGELMELVEEVPLKELDEAELEKLVRGWRREAGKQQLLQQLLRTSPSLEEVSLCRAH